MKVAVIGAGAVGGYYGGALAKARLEVALICRGAHRDAIVSDGLRVTSNWGDYTVRPQATPDSSEVGPVDLVLYAVKLYSNPSALPLIEPLLGDGTVVLPLQNGTESADIIADVYGWDRVLAGTTYIEAARTGDGQIEQTGSTARIAFGEQDGARSERVERVVEILDREGVQTEVSADIRKTLWSKLVLVGAIGSVMHFNQLERDLGALMADRRLGQLAGIDLKVGANDGIDRAVSADNMIGAGIQAQYRVFVGVIDKLDALAILGVLVDLESDIFRLGGLVLANDRGQTKAAGIKAQWFDPRLAAHIDPFDGAGPAIGNVNIIAAARQPERGGSAH